MECPFCGNTECISEKKMSRIIFHCQKLKVGCGGFFVHPDCFDAPIEQKKRYLLHTNELVSESEANGYRKYLEKFVSTVLHYERKKVDSGNVHTLFDYGSGPTPALVMLLNEYNAKFAFQNDVIIKHWDPFFYPHGDFFEKGADIVFCLEVIEHFENPFKGFQGLEKACSKDGLIAIQTQLTPDTFEEFNKWWYKEDSTHVSFYSLKSIEECAKKVGLVLEGEKNGVVFLRKKSLFIA